MKRIFLFFILLLTMQQGQAATPSGSTPVMDFGESVYGAGGYDSISMGLVGTIRTAGTGYLSAPTGTSRAYITFSDMDPTNKYVWLKPARQSATLQPVSACGATLAVSSLSAYNFSPSTKPSSYTIGTSTTFAHYPEGAGFSATIQLEGTPNKTCIFDATLAGEILYLEKKGSGGTYSPLDLIIRFKVILPDSFSHDENAELNFGTFCSSSSQDQTLTITPSGTVGGASVVCPASADISADSFTVYNPSSETFTVSLPSSATLYNGDNTLTVQNFTSSCDMGCTTLNGEKQFGVGGTITVPRNAAVGEYVGNYTVGITY